MEAEKKNKKNLANYIWVLSVPNAVYISHLLLISRKTPVDLLIQSRENELGPF